MKLTEKLFRTVLHEDQVDTVPVVQIRPIHSGIDGRVGESSMNQVTNRQSQLDGVELRRLLASDVESLENVVHRWNEHLGGHQQAAPDVVDMQLESILKLHAMMKHMKQ